MHARSLPWVWICGLFVTAVLTREPWSASTQNRVSWQLRVSSQDSLSGKPVVGAQVHMGLLGWYVSDTHRERLWFAYTDSGGKACLDSIPAGEYTVSICHNLFERLEFLVTVGEGSPDSLIVSLAWHGPPSDGRRCETVFFFGDTYQREQALERRRHGLEVIDTVATKAPKARKVH